MYVVLLLYITARLTSKRDVTMLNYLNRALTRNKNLLISIEILNVQ